MPRRIPIRVVRRKIRGFLRSSVRYDHMVLAFMALVIGVIVAYATIAFRQVIAGVQFVSFGTNDERLTEWLGDASWWQVLLPPVAGGIVLAFLYRYFTTDHRGQGVADVIEANALKDGRIDLKTGLVSALANAVALGAGASAGREGPVVHLGATLASWTARQLHLTPAVGRMLLACGVASAVAASFNAPIAGVFFALEVVMGHYAIHAFAPVVIAGVAGTMVSRIYIGDFPAFIVPEFPLVSFLEMPAFAIVGVAAALVAIVFTRSIMWSDDIARKLPIPTWALPPVGGLMVGLIALAVPEVLGVGYEATDNALHGIYTLDFLLLLLVAKMVAVAASTGFRFGSGVFSPSLYLGAMTGGIIGLIAAGFMPEMASSPGLYAIVGMGAVASAVLGAPVSTVLIIFELTGDYSITIAVMIAGAVASLITGLAHKSSFFYWQLERRGLHLEGGKALYLLKSTDVEAAMSRDFLTVKPAEPLAQVRDILIAQYGGKLLVADETGALVGVITSSEMTSDTFDPNLDTLIRAEDICRRNPVTVCASDSLEDALALLERIGEEHVPVIRDEESRIIVGMLHHKDVLRLYNRALVDAQTEMHDVKRRL